MSATSASSSPGERGPWLFGPAVDLALGAGLLYVAIFVVQSVAGSTLRAAVPLTAMAGITLVFGAPHYGATLLRVYGDRTDRHRYALVALHGSALLFVVYLAGMRWPLLGSLLITLYFTISPWHYSGQNFGVAMLFLRRGDVALDRATRGALQLSFVLSYALVFLALHIGGGRTEQAVGSTKGTIYTLTTLDLPRALGAPLALAVAIAYALCLGYFFVRVRHGQRRALLAASCVIGAQALWFALPMLIVLLGGSGILDPLAPESRAYSFMWIATAHFVQYLWITSYYAAPEGGSRQIGSFYVKTLLAGATLWFLPLLIFAPGYLGERPLSMGTLILTAAVVNLHHFALDSVVWKLRDGRVARILLREAGGVDGERSPVSRGAPWLRRLGWAGAALLLLSVLLIFHEQGQLERAVLASDPVRIERAKSRLGWLGRANPAHEVALAQALLLRGHLDLAREALDRADKLASTAEGEYTRARILIHDGRRAEALDALERALALEPGHARALREKAALERSIRGGAYTTR